MLAGHTGESHRLRAALLPIIRKKYDINKRTTGCGSSATAVRQRCRRTPPYASDPLQRPARDPGRPAHADGDRPRAPGCVAQPDYAQAPAEHAITVSARKLQDILRALPEGTAVALDLQDKRLQIKAGKSKFSLQTLPAQDFPKLAPAGAASATLELGQRDLKQLLGLVQYAMAQQDIRYYLNGMLLVAGAHRADRGGDRWPPPGLATLAGRDRRCQGRRHSSAQSRARAGQAARRRRRDQSRSRCATIRSPSRSAASSSSPKWSTASFPTTRR